MGNDKNADPRDWLPQPFGYIEPRTDLSGYDVFDEPGPRRAAIWNLHGMQKALAHARPEAVDEAMVERACVAHFNGMYAGGNGSGTAFTWEAAPESMKAKPRQAMHAALTAALTPERAP